MNKPGWLSRKREEKEGVIEPNREANSNNATRIADALRDMSVPRSAPTAEPIAQRRAWSPTPGNDRIGGIDIQLRERRDEQEKTAICGGTQPKSGEASAVRRTFRIDERLDRVLSDRCEGNINGFVQGLLVFALEELARQDKVMQVAFVNEDGTPARRVRAKNKKDDEAVASAPSSPSGQTQKNGGDQ